MDGMENSIDWIAPDGEHKASETSKFVDSSAGRYIDGIGDRAGSIDDIVADADDNMSEKNQSIESTDGVDVEVSDAAVAEEAYSEYSFDANISEISEETEDVTYGTATSDDSDVVA